MGLADHKSRLVQKMDGAEPLAESKLTQIYVEIYRH